MWICRVILNRMNSHSVSIHYISTIAKIQAEQANNHYIHLKLHHTVLIGGNSVIYFKTDCGVETFHIDCTKKSFAIATAWGMLMESQPILIIC